MLYVDWSSNNKGNGASIILEGLNDIVLEYSLNFIFKATNNQVDYNALVATLQLAKEVRVQTLDIKSDLQLVIAQMWGEYEVKDSLLIEYVQIAKRLLKEFDYNLQRILREEND